MIDIYSQKNLILKVNKIMMSNTNIGRFELFVLEGYVLIMSLKIET
jgi:hypothetical protein